MLQNSDLCSPELVQECSLIFTRSPAQRRQPWPLIGGRSGLRIWLVSEWIRGNRRMLGKESWGRRTEEARLDQSVECSPIDKRAPASLNLLLHLQASVPLLISLISSLLFLRVFPFPLNLCYCIYKMANTTVAQPTIIKHGKQSSSSVGVS